MRKIWGILLFVLACNLASFAVRTADLELSADMIACYIDEQDGTDGLDSRPENYALQQNFSYGVRALQSGANTQISKQTVLHHSCQNFAEQHTRHFSKELSHSQHQSQPLGFFHAKELYVYRLRHIVI